MEDVDSVDGRNNPNPGEDLGEIVEGGEQLVDSDSGNALAEKANTRKKLQHVCLTLWDTSEAHREELRNMFERYKWVGLLEGKEVAPDTGRLHLHVYVQTHHTRRKRITEIRKWFMNEDADVRWPGGVWIAEVRCKLEYTRYCKKDGNWNLTGTIFTDSNASKGFRTDRHDLRNAIYEEGVHSLKELRYRFPNQMSAPGGEAHARLLINDVTPVRAPKPLDTEYLWEHELRCKLAEPDNGREIITVHSAQTRQGKTEMMKHLEHEYNTRRNGSCLKITAAGAKDMVNTIKDHRHTLELLIVEIAKAKDATSDQYKTGMFAMLENIKDGSIFSGKHNTEIVRFKHSVKIIVCRNDMHKPDMFYGEDREAHLTMSKDTWEWVSHRNLRERWNASNPDDTVRIDNADYDDDGWHIEHSGKKKIDHGKWFRGRTVLRQVEQLEKELDKDVKKKAKKLAYLKRKHAGLKIATWVFKRVRPSTEEVEDVSGNRDEVEETLTSEENDMLEMLRAINKNRSNVLLKNHMAAARVLKRKRDKMEQEAAFNFNSRKY